MKMNIRLFTIAMSALLGLTGALSADDGELSKRAKVGSLKGTVIDTETRASIPGATVLIVGTDQGAAADQNGEFKINDIPVGSYSLAIRSLGYEPTTRTDIIVRAGRVTVVEAGLRLSPTEIQGMKAVAGYFPESPTEPTSSTNFSGEEIRRAPGSAGDVSRIMFSLPSVAKINDQVNNLIVRGGSPTENAFYLDNIEIPNINHYPLFGTSGGPISLLNVDFINDVNFSAGGFSAAYGDHLSSVMDLSFREGNREEIDLQADLNFAGFGLVGEGPIQRGKSSWMLSVRRSYLDLLVDAIGVGVVPRYSDYQGKVVYDLSPSHRLSFVGVLGVDYIDFDRESAIEDGNITDGWSDGYEYAGGVNWRYLWKKNGYSNTSLSYLATRSKANYFETSSGLELVDQDNTEGAAQVRNVNFYRLSDRHEIEFGIEAKYIMNSYDYFASEYTDFFGDTIPALIIDDKIESPKAGVFFSYIVRPFHRLQTTFGLRYDYFEYTEDGAVSPRFAMSYSLSDRTKLNASFGIYNQSLPMVLLSQRESNRYLNSPRAFHYVLGVEQMLSDDTRLTVEGYYKAYDRFPMNVEQPENFIVDEMVYNVYFFNHEKLRDDGKARSYGIETTLQKKLAQGLYGLVSGAWFRSEYEDLFGTWRPRSFDNRLILGAEGGYKPNEKWEFSLRWIYGGGAPFTPLDLAASELINRSVFDQSRVNEDRYPDYHSLNVRVDRRYNFSNSNIVVYASIWNAYNRKNIANYYWNGIEKKQDEMLQWSLLPVFGVEFEF